MKGRFLELLTLIDSNPAAYLEEVERLRDEDPERFANLVECMRQEVDREGWSRPRRASSIRALALGQVDELLAKHRARKV